MAVKWWRPSGSAVGLVTVAVLSGLMFGTSARLFSGQESESPTDVADLVREYSRNLDSLEDEVSELRSERDAYVNNAVTGAFSTDPELLQATSGTELSGPGVRVRMWDAPTANVEGTDSNDLVVHQQDIEAVVNALWAGGAEGVTIQGERLTASSAIRCVGNVLLLHNHRYSPPYVIEAVGDPDELQDALEQSADVGVYLEWVDAVRLGWEVTELSEIDMPAYSGTLTMEYAKVREESND